MNPYGPYQTERKYELARLLRKYDMEPSMKVTETARTVAHLMD